MHRQYTRFSFEAAVYVADPQNRLVRQREEEIEQQHGVVRLVLVFESEAAFLTYVASELRPRAKWKARVTLNF